MPKNRGKSKLKSKSKRPKKRANPIPQTSAQRREQSLRIQNEQARRGREISPLPEIVDPARRERGRLSLEKFGLEYFPRRFRLPNSAAHTTAAKTMQRCTDDGGKFACAMPRGTGKTAWAEVAVIRAVV